MRINKQYEALLLAFAGKKSLPCFPRERGSHCRESSASTYKAHAAQANKNAQSSWQLPHASPLFDIGSCFRSTRMFDFDFARLSSEEPTWGIDFLRRNTETAPSCHPPPAIRGSAFSVDGNWVDNET